MNDGSYKRTSGTQQRAERRRHRFVHVSVRRDRFGEIVQVSGTYVRAVPRITKGRGALKRAAKRAAKAV